ncbi:MAG: cation-transporting P-type ATPase, partial [Hyphomicrobium sp.]
PASTLAILLHQLNSSVVALLAVAAALSAAFGDYIEAAAILVVLLLNTLIGFLTEYKAERSMEALRSLGAHVQRVRRHGVTLLIDAGELVPGDILLLEAGDVATADARLLGASSLMVDEASLTGESVPVDKSTTPVPAATGLADRTSMLFNGTAITRGTATAVVIAIGMATELGHVAQLTSSTTREASPLTRNLARLSTQLVVLTTAIAALVAAAGIVQGQPPLLMVEAAIALAVAAIPEGLPIVATLVLARGMWRMAEKNAVIERLAAVETLGATTVIFTDKTGTLTENNMTVRRIVTPTADVTIADARAFPLDAVMRRLLRAAVLCNDAVLDGPGQAAIGDPLELALLAAARVAGIEQSAELAAHPETARSAFDNSVRMMATIHGGDGGALVAVKGAPEAVIGRAAFMATADGDVAIDDGIRAEWNARTEGLSRSGLRVLALAERSAGHSDGDPYRSITLLGLAGLYDPPRADVRDAIAACRRAGIRVIMVTGDHAVTAASIAGEIGLTTAEPRVVEGRHLDPPDGVADATILAADVFARVSPAQKLALVARYQAAGHVVAMTGDGVNDAPALEQADIGVAMGLRGTEVARQAAAMVLRDDRFTTIVTAIREGRTIFANIRRFVTYLLACNIAEVMVVGLALLAGMPLPLQPLQILFLNLVTDVFPAFALALSEGGETSLDQPPRDPREPLVGPQQWLEIALYAAAMTLATLAAMALAQPLAQPLAQTQLGTDPRSATTMAFLTLGLVQLWHVFNMADRRAPTFINEITTNRAVWLALAICLALLWIACNLPFVARILQLSAPDARQWGIALALSCTAFMLGRGAVWLAGVLRARQSARHAKGMRPA